MRRRVEHKDESCLYAKCEHDRWHFTFKVQKRPDFTGPENDRLEPCCSSVRDAAANAEYEDLDREPTRTLTPKWLNPGEAKLIDEILDFPSEVDSAFLKSWRMDITGSLNVGMTEQSLDFPELECLLSSRTKTVPKNAFRATGFRSVVVLPFRVIASSSSALLRRLVQE